MKYKHTPGPWKAVDKRPNSPGFSIFSGSQYIGFIGDSDSKTNCAGNAHLIAAAPELLEALEQIIDRWDTPLWKDATGTAEYINAARKIVASVKGK